MKTNKWGPPGWTFLHTIAHNYPEIPTIQDKINYKIFYSQCEHMLPCKYCRQSYQQYIIELPIDNFLESRVSVAHWMYLIHNKVNAKLRDQGYKVEEDPPFIEVCEQYEKYRAGCGKPKNKGPSCRLPVTSAEIQNNIDKFVKHEKQVNNGGKWY